MISVGPQSEFFRKVSARGQYLTVRQVTINTASQRACSLNLNHGWAMYEGRSTMIVNHTIKQGLRGADPLERLGQRELTLVDGGKNATARVTIYQEVFAKAPTMELLDVLTLNGGPIDPMVGTISNGF